MLGNGPKQIYVWYAVEDVRSIFLISEMNNSCNQNFCRLRNFSATYFHMQVRNKFGSLRKTLYTRGNIKMVTATRHHVFNNYRVAQSLDVILVVIHLIGCSDVQQ